MTREVNKAIMIRSKLGNKFLKDKKCKVKEWLLKTTQFMCWACSQGKTARFYSLDLSWIVDSKKFWKTIKPLFLDKFSHREKNYFNGR